MSVRGGLYVLLVLILGALGAMAWQRAEGDAPRIEAPGEILVGAAGRSVELALADADAGLREVEIALVHARGELALLRREFPGGWIRGGATGAERVALALAPEAGEVPDGTARLRVALRDWSWRRNETRLEVPVVIDRKPPRISLASGLTYVDRGGSGAVAYSVSEPTRRDGVQVGREGEAGAAFYRGFPADRSRAREAAGRELAPAGARVALFAVGKGAPPGPEIRVVAVDAAGNAARARWPVVVKDRAFPQGNVTLPQDFLERKVEPLARAEGIDAADRIAAFREINTNLRQRNEARIRELVTDTAPEPLWRGAFEQLRSSKVTSRFAEDRLYFVDGRRVSEATHYGYDLASTAAAPVTAGNGGRVIYAGDLGIYGGCVLVDHGLGLVSLYGHLSRIDVAAGDRVEKGRTLGLSGATGLAGGDHLHYAMLVGSTYVDPVEWWDPKWVESHVGVRLPAPAP